MNSNSSTFRTQSALVVALPFLALALHPVASALGKLRWADGAPSGPSETYTAQVPQAAAERVPVVFTGGHDTDRQDQGRPAILVAAGLGVPAEVFRAAFRNVRPAPSGQAPHPDLARANKSALMSALGPYGVTNERLDTVSNFYRYRPGRNELWRHRPAAAYATIRDGAVVGFTITDPGHGYSSAPGVTVPGFTKQPIRATVAYSKDLERNGSISALTLAPR